MPMGTLTADHRAKLPRRRFPARSRRAAAAQWGIVALFLLLMAAPVAANPVTLEGVTFSDESGDFTILSVTGLEAWPTPLSLSRKSPEAHQCWSCAS